MVALIAVLTIMFIGLSIAAPNWNSIVQHQREDELVFNGFEIVKGIRMFQQRNGNAFPISLEQMVKAKVLRQQYRDPMAPLNAKNGGWRFIRPETPPPECQPQLQPGQPPNQPAPPPPPPNQAGPREDLSQGPFAGVISLSRRESYGVFNLKNHYHEWCFSVNVIPEGIHSMLELRLALMTVPQGRLPRFTGQGKRSTRDSKAPSTSPDNFFEVPPSQ
jgi:type II secretory pathway pseudopilin PulG